MKPGGQASKFKGKIRISVRFAPAEDGTFSCRVVAVRTVVVVGTSRDFYFYTRRAQLAPSEKYGMDKNHQVHFFHYTFCTSFTHRLAFYNIRALQMTSSVVTGDYMYFPEDLVFPQNHCQARQSLAFLTEGEPGCLVDGSHCNKCGLETLSYFLSQCLRRRPLSY